MPPKSKKKKQSTGNNLPFILLAIGLVLLIAAGVWLLGRGQQVSTTVVRTSLADATTAHEQKTALFLDVRSEAQFAESHVAGAYNILSSCFPTVLGSWIKSNGSSPIAPDRMRRAALV